MKTDQKMGRSTRRKLQSVFMHHELVTLAVFANQWMEAEEMYYTDAYRRERCMEVLQKFLGSKAGPGLLQEKMEHHMHGILSRLREDFPTISWHSCPVRVAEWEKNCNTCKIGGIGNYGNCEKLTAVPYHKGRWNQ